MKLQKIFFNFIFLGLMHIPTAHGNPVFINPMPNNSPTDEECIAIRTGTAKIKIKKTAWTARQDGSWDAEDQMICEYTSQFNIYGQPTKSCKMEIGIGHCEAEINQQNFKIHIGGFMRIFKPDGSDPTTKDFFLHGYLKGSLSSEALFQNASTTDLRLNNLTLSMNQSIKDEKPGKPLPDQVWIQVTFEDNYVP